MRSAALLLLTGCLYPPHDYTGLACDGARPCPQGYACVASRCAGAGGAGGGVGGSGGSDDLLPNGGFEDGGTGWYATSSNTDIEVQSATVRSGVNAMRVFTKTAGNYLGLGLERTVIGGVAAGRTYCVEAFVDRGTTTVPIDLVLRRYGTSSGDWEDFDGTKTNPSVAGWQRVTGSLATAAPYDQFVNLRFSGDAVLGAEYFVDDVKVTVSATGTCP